VTKVRANGIEIEYEDGGRKEDPAVLTIMGYGSQLTRWKPSLYNGLAAKGLYVIRFDNRDVGLSTHLAQLSVPRMPELVAKAAAGEPIAPPYTLDDMAADAVGLLDALGIARAHVVGASMGGMIAQLVAIHYPERVKSLVSIMSTTGRRGLPAATPEASAAIFTGPPSSEREDRIATLVRQRRAIASPGYPPTDAELRAGAELDVDRAPYDPAGLVRQMAAIMAAPARNEMLKQLRMPTLVLHGRDDPLVPVECGRDTAASIPGAELVIVPGMAHDFSEALTPLYLQHVGGFIQRVEARSA
jgi:pimeloyl-ACP methyl ester carboxylesterase